MGEFPKNFGNELAGMDFEDVFEKKPKWIECVNSTWTENCTGLFLEFLQFVKLRLSDPVSKIEHEFRCREYVKTLAPNKIPEYLVKYSKDASSRTPELPLAEL